MNDIQIEKIREELMRTYPGCRVVVPEGKGEVIGEIAPGRAVAVIERSQSHFHTTMRERYRAIRGTLYVVCGGRGHVLREGKDMWIEAGDVHFARAAGEAAWIEVESEPPWSPDDHHVL